MDVRVIKITSSAQTEGRLNIKTCGKAFFPASAFGSSMLSKGRGQCLRLKVYGLSEMILTDIPTDTLGRPRWFFRERGWVKTFVKVHNLQPGSKVIIRRTAALQFEVEPFGSGGDYSEPSSNSRNGMLFDPKEFFEAATPKSRGRHGKNGDLNRLSPEDRPAHDWYRFVLSYPPHLVREYAERFGLGSTQRVLDPFCGTGTTLVECQKMGIQSVGIEANPFAHFASVTKLDWTPDPDRLVEHAERIARATLARLAEHGIQDQPPLRPQPKRGLRALPTDAANLLLSDSISPLPLHKTLLLLEVLREQRDERFDGHERLALAKAIVFSISNLHFGPEVGVAPAKPDSPVIGPWLHGVRSIANDLRGLQLPKRTHAEVHNADARSIDLLLKAQSIDAVITSPPYPNEKDYTRTTRLESVLLDFIKSKADLRTLKRTLIRSNTRGVYKEDDDDTWISDHPEIQRIADAIEARRLELGKTSGFERMYHRVTKLYFGGMARHLAQLRAVLRPGAQLAYVVGDQASYLRVMIRTGELLAAIGRSLGYELVDIDLFRTRLATATREQLREEVVIFRWPGTKKRSKARSKVRAAQ